MTDSPTARRDGRPRVRGGRRRPRHAAAFTGRVRQSLPGGRGLYDRGDRGKRTALVLDGGGERGAVDESW